MSVSNFFPSAESIPRFRRIIVERQQVSGFLCASLFQKPGNGVVLEIVRSVRSVENRLFVFVVKRDEQVDEIRRRLDCAYAFCIGSVGPIRVENEFGEKLFCPLDGAVWNDEFFTHV